MKSHGERMGYRVQCSIALITVIETITNTTLSFIDSARRPRSPNSKQEMVINVTTMALEDDTMTQPTIPGI